MWRGGCIIKSVFLGDITAAYQKNGNLESLLFDDFFNKAWYVRQPLSRNELYADCLHPAVLSVANSSRCVDVPHVDVPVATPLRLATDDNTCHHRSSYAECARCKGKGKQPAERVDSAWMLDSGASMHFTYSMNDYVDFRYYGAQRPLNTADK